MYMYNSIASNVPWSAVFMSFFSDTFPSSYGLFLHVLALFAHFHIHRCEYDSCHQDQSTGHQVRYRQKVILPTKPGHHGDHQLLLTSKGLDRKIWSYWSRLNLHLEIYVFKKLAMK